MARMELMNEEDGTVFVLNETIVGKGADNRKRSDVQLIQFFLRQFFIPRPALFAKLPKDKFNTGVLTIDGKFGPQTGAGILVFQRDIRFGKGLSIKDDGIVNVATAVKSSITGTTYTILHLNAVFFNENSGGDPNILTNLQSHPDIVAFAPELQAELAAISEIDNLF